ncbi:hypothetical protein BCR43DRAFT_490690 [Syncephalastrum racemosum]|uniref:Uncharacterized protein n=1 Tax=Syncephalastrum racemosum TaxID=13706 RepID=A0A1X2HGG4_SYNRA|nr:hypothetical protein BCR43DRAFT_490690 [Syncephalastrum racemosum]
MRLFSYGSIVICILASSLALAIQPNAPVAAIDPEVRKNMVHLNANEIRAVSSGVRKYDPSVSHRKRSYIKLARRMMSKRDQPPSSGPVGGVLNEATTMGTSATTPVTAPVDGIQKGLSQVQGAVTSPLGTVSGKGVTDAGTKVTTVGNSADGLIAGGGVGSGPQKQEA